MDTKRRRHLTNPGEALLLATSAMDQAVRYTSWRDETGLPLDRIRAGTLCAVPLPVYRSVPEGSRQFAEVRPEALWHPLFWLPPRLARRYNLPDGKGGFEVEDDQLWSVRVGLEMSTSGIYTPEEGWIDVMALIGLDIENEVDLARIEEWLSGQPDDLLDTVTLEELLHIEADPDWSLTSAIALRSHLVEAQWALLADSLLGMIWEAADAPGTNLQELAGAVGIAASLAGVQLSGVPVDDEEPPRVFWDRIRANATGKEWNNRELFLEGPYKEAENWLTLTRESHWGVLDEITQELLKIAGRAA